MRGGLILAFAGALWAQAPSDPTEVLKQVRDRVVESRPRLPDYTCVQTVNRSYFKRAKQPYRFPSCAQMHAEKDTHAYQLDLRLTDRLRLDVKVSGSVEIGAWAGAGKFDSKSIFDLVGSAPFGTGALGMFLYDIFSGAGTQFDYTGEVLSDGETLYQYSYRVPLPASHYLVKAGKEWQAVAYEGEFGIDPRSSQLRRLVLRAGSLPLETEACEVVNGVDYAMVRMSRGEFLLPQRNRIHILMANTEENEITTTYAGCREYQSESTISFGDDSAAGAAEKKVTASAPARLPPGVPISLELVAPIDTDLAAAGDIVMLKVRRPVRVEGSEEALIPKGATVRGRIIKMQHWMLPPRRFDIAIRLEAWEAGGVSAPLYAKPDLGEPGLNARWRTRGVPIDLPPAAQSARVRTYAITTNRERYVLPRGFESKWITIKPPAEP